MAAGTPGRRREERSRDSFSVAGDSRFGWLMLVLLELLPMKITATSADAANCTASPNFQVPSPWTQQPITDFT
jgi:hypothetical protein